MTVTLLVVAYPRPVVSYSLIGHQSGRVIEPHHGNVSMNGSSAPAAFESALLAHHKTRLSGTATRRRSQIKVPVHQMNLAGGLCCLVVCPRRQLYISGALHHQRNHGGISRKCKAHVWQWIYPAGPYHKGVSGSNATGRQRRWTCAYSRGVPVN